MFYEFMQNNSGGSFDFDESAGITHIVVVEAESADQANSKAEEVGLYWDGCSTGQDCSCCGDRWYEASSDEGDKIPSSYGEPLTENTYKDKGLGKWMDEGKEACVHFQDGTVKWY